VSEATINLDDVKSSLRASGKQVKHRIAPHPLLAEENPGAETIAVRLIHSIVKALPASAANDIGAVIMITAELSRSAAHLGHAIVPNTAMAAPRTSGMDGTA
jgi:hypothetical protein